MKLNIFNINHRYVYLSNYLLEYSKLIQLVTLLDDGADISLGYLASP